jgi:8-oxo-dGTP diphosphatase
MASVTAIRAAGVVLMRTTDGVPEFLLVHRPGRRDWSLPKGKIDPGEHVIAAAVRECDEESGYSPVLEAPLPMQSYSVGSRPKVVHYWRARVREEVGFAPDDEVDEVRWLPVSAAADQLTYPSEVRLVEAAAALPDSVPLILLRHTQALKRSQFDGDVDAERPLSGKGRSQSKHLVPLLDAYGITAVHSSPARRCHDTVKRFAKHSETGVVPEPALSEEGHHEDPAATASRAAELARQPEATVVCSHRPVFPTLLDSVAGALGLDLDAGPWRRDWDAKLPPGGFIVVHRAFLPDGGVQVVGVEQHSLSTAS